MSYVNLNFVEFRHFYESAFFIDVLREQKFTQPIFQLPQMNTLMIDSFGGSVGGGGC